jgi:hypothetical protein
MADEVLSGAGLYAAEPVRVLNPTGVNPNAAMGQIQGASERKQQGQQFQQAQAQEQGQFQQSQQQGMQVHRESMALQERLQSESISHTERLARRSEQFQVGMQVRQARYQQMMADPTLDLTLEMDQLDEEFGRQESDLNEKIITSQAIAGLMSGQVGPQGVASMMETMADIVHGYDKSAATLVDDLAEAAESGESLDVDKTWYGDLAEVAFDPVIGDLLGLDLPSLWNPDVKSNTFGMRMRVDGEEVDPRGKDEKATLGAVWGTRGAKTIEQARAMQEEFQTLVTNELTRGGGTDRAGKREIKGTAEELEAGRQTPVREGELGEFKPGTLSSKRKRELMEEAAARVKDGGRGVTNWREMGRRAAAVVADTVTNKGPETHNQVAGLIEGMLQKADRAVDNPAQQLELADQIKKDYQSLKEMGVNTTVLDLALSKMAGVARDQKTAGDVADHGSQQGALAGAGLSPAGGKGKSARMQRALGFLGSTGAFENWGGKQTQINHDRMVENMKKAMLELQGFKPDEQLRLMKVLADDDPTNDPEIAKKWEGMDPEYKKAFMGFLRTGTSTILAEMNKRGYEGSVDPEMLRGQRDELGARRGARETTLKQKHRAASKDAHAKAMDELYGDFMTQDPLGGG